MVRRLLLVALVTLSGCAHPRHVAVTVDASLYETVSDIHAAEQRALCGQPSCAGVATAPTVPGWTEAKSQAFNRALLPAATAGQNLNRALAAWTPGQPLPSEIQSLITSIGAALTNVTQTFPDGEAKAGILKNIAIVQQMALDTLANVLAVANAR